MIWETVKDTYTLKKFWKKARRKEYYAKGAGNKPDLNLQEYKDFKDLLTVTADDNNGQTCIGAINKDNKGDVYNSCTFNFIQATEFFK